MALVVPVALTALIGLAGCGGGLSKPAYIAKVDPICAKYKKQADAIPQPTSLSDTNALATYYSQLGDLADKQTREIDDAGRPKDGKKQIDDLLKLQRSQIDQLSQLTTAVRANDQTKVQQISDAADPVGKQIDSDLKAFGFKVCGSQ